MTAPQQSCSRAMTSEQQAVFSALDSAVQGVLSASEHQLNTLGALRGVGRANAICQYSAALCDALPKSGVSSVGEQLQEKQGTHQLLLNCLGDAGALARLHPTCLRLVFEDGQLLAALQELRQLAAKQPESAAGPLHAVVLAAGQAAASAVAGSGDRAPLDLFYSYPLTTVPQFFAQVAAAAASLGKQPGRAAADQEAVAQLSRAVQAALGGAMQQRGHQQQWFGSALSTAVAGMNSPEWIAGALVRSALKSLAEATCRLHALLLLEAPPQVHQENRILALELTDRLLNAWAAAVAAAAPGQQRRQLHRAYSSVKGQLLGWLLQQAQGLDLPQPEGESQLRRVEGLAEAHAAYAQLVDISRITGGSEELYRQMEQLLGDGLDPPFSAYVFGRLLQEGRHAELLDLPPQFDAVLQHWLNDETCTDGPARLQLRWLHELRTSSYAAASATLERLVESQQHDVDEEELERRMALQKLAGLAALGGMEIGAA